MSGADNATWAGKSSKSKISFSSFVDLIYSFWREAVQMTRLADFLALVVYIFGGHSYDGYYNVLTSF